MGRWLPVLYNTAVVIVISLKSPMQLHCIYTDYLISEDILIMSMKAQYVFRIRNVSKASVNWLL